MRVAEAATRLNIPIYTVAAGAEEGPRNVRVAELEASPVVFAKRPDDARRCGRSARASERRRGQPDRRAEGSMQGSGSRSANQRVALGEDGILKRTTFRVVPKVIGQYEYRARIEDAGPELTKR